MLRRIRPSQGMKSGAHRSLMLPLPSWTPSSGTGTDQIPLRDPTVGETRLPSVETSALTLFRGNSHNFLVRNGCGRFGSL